MARTIYFLDGSREVILSNDDEDLALAFERILQERLGDDAVQLYREVQEPISLLQDELKSYEGTVEDYRSLLDEVLETITSILKELPAAIQRKCEYLITTIKNQM